MIEDLRDTWDKVVKNKINIQEIQKITGFLFIF